jgi:hypothetical protein
MKKIYSYHEPRIWTGNVILGFPRIEFLQRRRNNYSNDKIFINDIENKNKIETDDFFSIVPKIIF